MHFTNRFTLTALMSFLLFFSTFTLASDGVEVDIVADDGYLFPMHPTNKSRNGAFRTYLEAQRGNNYGIRIKNNSNRRIGLVIAVDGRNIINGKKSYLRHSEKMYVLQPYAKATYDGWRTSKNKVNRFYFTKDKHSYAKAWGDNTAMGVIAIAVFAEKSYYPKPEYGNRVDKSNTRKSARRAENSAGTGYGNTKHSSTKKVHFTPKHKAKEKHFIKYEWRKTLCKKRIINCQRPQHQENRFWSEEDDFAPAPPNHYRY